MPTSDQEDNNSPKNEAVDKVVDAFRARRDGDETAPAPGLPVGDETPVVKVEPGQTPGGGDSETPTKTFAVPRAAAAAAARGSGTIIAETVVEIAGSGERAEVRDRPEVPAVDPDGLERAQIVESAVELPTGTAADLAAAEMIVQQSDDVDEMIVNDRTGDADEEAADEEAGDGADSDETDADSPADVTDTEVIEVAEPVTEQIPATTTATAATAAAAPTVKHKPEVIPGAAPKPAAKAGRRKWPWAVLALLIVVGIAAAWWFLTAQTAQNKAVDAAKDFNSAMVDGDLSALRNLTCGEEYAYYSSVSPEEFAKAHQSQQARNQILRFDDVTGVEVDGDTARVGVDVVNPADSSATTAAQVTLHQIDGAWKVCTQP